MGQLQAALPREHYVDPATWRRERDQVLARSWYCAGRLSELGLLRLEVPGVRHPLGEHRHDVLTGGGE